MFVSKKNFGEAFHPFPINSAFNNNYASILDILLDWDEITDWHKSRRNCRVEHVVELALAYLNYSHYKIKLSVFYHSFLFPFCLMARFCSFNHSLFYTLNPLSQSKTPCFCRWLLSTTPRTGQATRRASLCKMKKLPIKESLI